MAHHLDPGDLDELIGSVVEKLGPGYADRYKTPVERFRVAAFYEYGYFDAIRGSIRLREAYAPEVNGRGDSKKRVEGHGLHGSALESAIHIFSGR